MNPMREDAVLVDSSVLAYALGDPDARREPCRKLLKEITSGTGRAYASVEMFQEVLHHRLRRTRDRSVSVAEVRDAMPMFVLLNFDHEVLELSLDLVARTLVRGRDAVHAATALAYGIETIVSSDPAFDGIPGLRRLDPLAGV